MFVNILIKYLNKQFMHYLKIKMVIVMKKVFKFLMIIIFAFTLYSCGESYRIDKIENTIWKSDIFNITATSEQLKKYPNNQNKNYSTIYIGNKRYVCFVGFSWHSTTFRVILFDEESNFEISFYGEHGDFVYGYYSAVKKEINKEYKYSLKVELKEEGQYYEYCEENNLEFPLVINFYGYENK